MAAEDHSALAHTQLTVSEKYGLLEDQTCEQDCESSRKQPAKLEWLRQMWLTRPSRKSST